MNDLIIVRVFERLADLDGDGDDAREISWTSLRESRPGDVFHHEKRKPVYFADVVNRDDVWMIECRGGARFAEQTFARIGILSGDEFYCDFALELEVSGAKDCAHAAATELAVEPVAFAQDRAKSRGSRRAEVIRKDARLLRIEHV